MSPEPNQPGASVQPDDQNGQSPVIPGRPTADLIKDIDDLRTKVEEAKRRKEEHIQGLVKDNYGLRTQGGNLEKAFEEAEKSLKYFEEAEKNGLLGEEERKAYESIKQRFEELKKVREETNAKAKAIYEQPEVNGRIVDEAQKENAERDEMADKKKFVDGLGAKVEEFLLEIEKTIEKRDELKKKRKDAWDAFSIARGKVEEMAPNKPFEKNTRLTARDLVIGYRDGQMTLDDLRTKLARGEASMGWGRGDEKKRILGMVDSPEFQDAEAKRAKSALADKEDEEYSKTLNNEGSKFESLKKKWWEEITTPYQELNERARKRLESMKHGSIQKEKGNDEYLKFREDVLKTINGAKDKFCSKYYGDRTHYGGYPPTKGEKETSVDDLFLRIRKPSEI